MNQEIISENCKDDYNHSVRLVQLIGTPIVSRLEILIFNNPQASRWNIPKNQQSTDQLRAAVYYNIIGSTPLPPVIANQNRGQATSRNANYIPPLRIKYDDNGSGLYVPDTFASIAQYMLHRLHELRFMGSDKKSINGKNIFDGAKSLDDYQFLKASLGLFKEYCHKKGYTYQKRTPPEEIDIKNH